jgi:hypothetical protein
VVSDRAIILYLWIAMEKFMTPASDENSGRGEYGYCGPNFAAAETQKTHAS